MTENLKRKTRWPIKPDELPLVMLASSFSFGAVALAIFFRTWSDTLFLSHFSVDQIPIFYIWSAFAFAPVTMAYSWLSKRLPPVQLNTITLLSFAGLSSFCARLPSTPILIFIILLMMSLVSPLVNAICWSVILERLDSLQSKRLIPIISSAATIGAICAGGLAAEVIELGGLAALITLISCTLVCLAALPRAMLGGREVNLSRKEAKRSPSKTTLWSGLGQLAPLMQNSLLSVTMVATLMMATTTNLVDFLFKAEVQQNIAVEDLGPFLARFHALTNLLIFILQFFVLNKLTGKLGLKSAYSLYPSSLFTFGTICLFPVGWFGLVVLRGVDTLMKFTVYTNTENLVLTPVPFVLRTQVKVLLKGAIYPLGGLIAGVMIWVISYGCQGNANLKIQVTLIFTLILSLLWIRFTRQAHLHYIGQLAENIGLSKMIVSLDQSTMNLFRQFLSIDIEPLKISQVSAFIEQLDQHIESPKNELMTAWQKNEQSRADLIEWIENMGRMNGIHGVGDRLEQMSATVT